MSDKKVGIKLNLNQKQIMSAIIIGFSIIFLLMGSLYWYFRDEYQKLSEKNKTYSVVITPNGQVQYIRTDEDGNEEIVTTEDMAEDFKEILKGYIDYNTEEEYTEKVEYLINAETVTKLPYIDSLADDPSQLNGIIKFYRYTNAIEAEEAVVENEEEENIVNPKELFYIGDSWMVGLESYIKNKVNDEYPGEDHFWAEVGLGARADKFSNANLKDRIDSVNSEVSAIVIMLGLNDTSEAASNKMKTIIDFLSDTYKEKNIYVLKVPHVGKAYKYEDIDANDLNEKIDEYNSRVLMHCAEISNVNFIDVTSDMMTDDLYLDTKYSESDGLHLNNTGKSVWYENIKECIGTGKSSSSTEKCRLTFIEREEFDNQMNNYKSSGNREIFKHFTIDDEGQVVIACGTEEKRTITTDDTDLNVDIVREVSGEGNYNGNAQSGFSMIRYTINEKPIDYLSLVEQYVMPSNLLYAFLIQTESIGFVEAIATLAYESEIEIGIYDNDTLSKDEETVTYIKKMEMDSKVQLNFDDLQTTNPVINKSALYSYNNLPYRCSASTSTKQHRVEYIKPSQAPKDTTFSADTYITGDNHGLITGLGNADSAKNYTINYKKIVTSNSVSTYGVTLADTWIARWKSTYKHEISNTAPAPNSGTYENADIIKYETMEATLNAFSPTKKNDISSKLDDHAKELKNKAVEQIYDNTEVPTISTSDVTLITKKDILKNHIAICSTCSDYIESWYTGGATYEETGITKPTIDTVYNAIYDEGKLEGTIVATHYNQQLNNHVNQANNNVKTAFKQELKNEITYSQSLTGIKRYENINYNSSYTRESTKYVRDENVETDKVGERFSEVFNNGNYHNAKMHILERTPWFWEYIRENEDTAKLEDILRLLLNIATDSNDFGEFTADQINELLKAFEPKERMISTSSSGNKLLKDYIRYWENASVLYYINGNGSYTDYVAKYINEEKTEYYIRDDGAGHPTVGFGIDIFNGGFVEEFKEMGYTEAQMKDMSGTVSVPVEFVDSLEDREISEAMETIQNKTAGLELENYQIYALVSRAYNCGTEGATYVRNGHNFVEAYNKYFNKETDLKYGETQGDFNHPLYTNYMASPTTSEGKVLPGLVKRRKSEWTLFQTGYMDTLEKWVSEGGTIMDCAEEIHAYMEEYEYTYCVYFNNSLEECSSSSQCGLNTTFEESKDGWHHTCCATYVSWVLQEAGYFERSDHTNGADDLKNKLVGKGWQQISSIDEAEPGDILWYGGHVDIYAGDGTKYNAGSGEAIRRDSPYKSSGVADAKMILRAP